jgi:hypothetical protein
MLKEEMTEMARWTHRCLALTVSVLFVLMLSGAAGAATYTISSANMSFSMDGSIGLAVGGSNFGLLPLTFTLWEVGDSISVPVFKVGTTESSAEGPPDTDANHRPAAVSFNVGSATSPDVIGESYGDPSTNRGYIDWGAPVLMDLGIAGGAFTISLQDVSFDMFSVNWESSVVPNIATFTLTQKPVPQPMTLLLLGAGVTGASFGARWMQRRRQ